jgi:hypothetical protein
MADDEKSGVQQRMNHGRYGMNPWVVGGLMIRVPANWCRRKKYICILAPAVSPSCCFLWPPTTGCDLVHQCLSPFPGHGGGTNSQRDADE